MFADTESPAFHHLPDLLSLDSTSTSHHEASPPPPSPPPMVPRGSALAGQRRQKLSDKTRCLQKLPWDKKMDMVTMLEEAYKYVKFLQAQLAALQSMPTVASSSSSAGVEFFGGLGMLNRNQLL